MIEIMPNSAQIKSEGFDEFQSFVAHCKIKFYMHLCVCPFIRHLYIWLNIILLCFSFLPLYFEFVYLIPFFNIQGQIIFCQEEKSFCFFCLYLSSKRINAKDNYFNFTGIFNIIRLGHFSIVRASVCPSFPRTILIFDIFLSQTYLPRFTICIF